MVKEKQGERKHSPEKRVAKVETREEGDSSEKRVAKVETHEEGDNKGLSGGANQTETDFVKKKTEEQLINRFLGPQYRNCCVHVVPYEMDGQARRYSKNNFHVSDFRIEVNSNNNKRIVHCVAQNQNVKDTVKFREDNSITEDNFKNSSNSSPMKGVLETNVPKKTQNKIKRPSYSRQTDNNSSKNDSTDSGQFISRDTLLEEKSKSSVSNNLKHSRRRRKSLSTTDDEEHYDNDYSDKFNTKKPCFTKKNVSVKKSNTTRNLLCENSKGIHKSEKKQEESHVEAVTDNEEYDGDRCRIVNVDSAKKMSVSPDVKEGISTKTEPSLLKIKISRNKSSPANGKQSNGSGMLKNNKGKCLLVKTLAEKKMYEDLELAKVGRSDPKQVPENDNGESKSGTEDKDCSVIKVDKNNKQKKIVKGSAALFNNVKTKHKPDNTENVVESALPVVSEDTLSRFDQQGDCTSRKKINGIQKETVKIPTNSVAEQLSKKNILKPSEGDSNNNKDENGCITKRERKNIREDSAETTSSLRTRNLNSSETLDSSDQVISDQVEQYSKGSDIQNNSIKTDKQSMCLIDDQQNASGNQGQRKSGGDLDECHKNNNAFESQNISITGEQDQYSDISDDSECVISDDEEQSSSNGEKDHCTEQAQHTSSDEQDESSSSDEEDRSVSNFEQIHRTSVIIQKRTSESDVDDSVVSVDGQNHYISSVERNKVVNDDDKREVDRTVGVKRKVIVIDSDGEDYDKHIHHASSIKQRTLVNDERDKQIHSVSDKNLNQNVNNDGQTHSVHNDKLSTLMSDEDDDARGEHFQCMSGEKQSQYLSDDEDSEGISGDEQEQSVNYSEMKQHISKQIFENSSTFSDRKSVKTIEKPSLEKMLPPAAIPPLLRNRSVRIVEKNCEKIMRKVPSNRSSEKCGAPCVKSIPAAAVHDDDCKNSDDSDDNCSDVLSLCADSEIMDFVTTCALNSSVPNPFLRTTGAPKRDVFGTRSNHRGSSGLSTNTNTLTVGVVTDSITVNRDKILKNREENKVTDTADFETSRNVHGYKNSKPSVLYVNDKKTNSDTVNNVPVATTNDNYETETSAATDKSFKVIPPLSDVPNRTVSASSSHSESTTVDSSSEIKSIDGAVKQNFKIPKIVKTNKTESDADNSASEKNDRQRNDVLKRDTVLSESYPGLSFGNGVEYNDRLPKTSVKTSSTERRRDSRAVEKNVKHGRNGLLRRSPEPSADKETEYGRTTKINVNACSTESMKDGPVPERIDKCRSNELLTREAMSVKRGSEPSSVKETELGRIPKFDVKTDNIDRGKVSSPVVEKTNAKFSALLTREIVSTKRSREPSSSVKKTESVRISEFDAKTGNDTKLPVKLRGEVSPLADKNDKYRTNKVLTRETVSTKKGLEPSSGKETEPGSVPKFDVKTGSTDRDKVSPASETYDNCRRNVLLTREIVNKRIPITFERNETEHDANRRKLMNEVSQERKAIKLGSSLPLTVKTVGRDGENIRRTIVLKNNLELKIRKEVAESSTGNEQNCGTVQRKTVDGYSAVPEKKLRSDDSLPMLVGNKTYGKSPETATNGNKECTERPAAGRPNQLAEVLKPFVRKEAFNNTIAANEDSVPQVGESSAGSMETTPRRHKRIRTSNERSLSTDCVNREEYEKSAILNTLFADCCMTYLRTSKCDRPCSLSHTVGGLLIDKNSNNGDEGVQLKALEEFISEAPKPPLCLIDSLCTTFVIHRKAHAIFNATKIFTNQCAYSDGEYTRNVLKILLHTLRQCYGDTESSLTAIVNCLCKDVELNDSRQEILDKMVTAIEETVVEINNRWDIFSGLASVREYVWSQTLLDNVLNDFTVKHQRYLLESKNLNAVRDYVLVLCRASQEENLFNIWKRVPGRLSKLYSFVKRHQLSVRVLSAKIKWFEYVDHVIGRYMPREQFRQLYGEGDTTETELARTDNHGTVPEDVEKHSRLSAVTRAESRNSSGVHNRLLSGNKETVNIPNFNNSSVDRMGNAADTSPVDQKWTRIRVDQPWTVTSSSGSRNNEFSDVHTPRSSSFERPHSAGDGGVGSKTVENVNKHLSRNDHYLMPRPCNFNITKNETYLEELDNLRENTPSLSNYKLVDGRLDNRENYSTNVFTRLGKKMEWPVLPNKADVHMTDQYQLRGINDGNVFQNVNSSCSGKTNLSLLHNDDEMDYRRIANYNINNKERNVPTSNNNNERNMPTSNNNNERNMPTSNNRRYCPPRPSGYRQRLNQFNKDKHLTAIHDAQQQRQQCLAESEPPSKASRTCIQYPVEIAEACSSKSCNDFNSYDSFLSNGNAEQQHVHDKKLCKAEHRRLKRSRSTTSLHADVRKSESTCNKTTYATIDDTCLSRRGHTGRLSDIEGRQYLHREHESDCHKEYLPSKWIKNVANSTNHDEQHLQKRFSALPTEDYTEKNQWAATNVYNGRAQITRPNHSGGESRGIVSVLNMRTETDDIPSTSSGLNSDWNSVTPSADFSVNLPFSMFPQNRRNTRQFTEEPMFNSGQQSTVRLQSGCSALPDHSSITRATTRRRISSTKQTFTDLEEDAISIQRFLDVNDYHHVLNILDKWQNTEFISDLTKHVFVLMANVNKKTGYEKCYNSFRGLLSTAINSGKLSPGMRKSLASVALNLILDMIVSDNWDYAYEIVSMILEHGLPFSSCEVYRDPYSAAKRNLVFAEVCMKNEDLEQAVTLINKHSMLAVDRKEWSLRSVVDDVVIRNELVKTLLLMTVASDNLNLAYNFLINLMEAQKDVSKPIKLISSYELLLRKLLDQTDTLMGLRLFKEISAYQDVPLVVDRILCRALVVACYNENEIDLAKQLVKRGYFIGAYIQNNNLFTVKISSLWTQVEMTIFVEEALNTILDHVTEEGSTVSARTIDRDLHFPVVEGKYQDTDLPKLLMDVDISLTGAVSRLKSVLRSEFHPALYVDRQESNSPYVVVKKSVLVSYFSYRLQNVQRR